MRAGRPKADALTRHVEPAVGVRVVREKFLDLGIGFVDVFRVPRQSHPAEWALALAEHRADVGGYKARKIKGIFDAMVKSHLADVVAVIHRGYTHGLEIQHGLHLSGAALRRIGR